MSVQTNAAEAAAKLRRADAAVRAALAGRLDELAHRAAADMRRGAPKWRSLLTQSIQPDQEGPLQWFVGPHVDYGPAVEHGRKPGKGLPMYGTAGAASAMAWLRERMRDAERKANPKFRAPRAGSARAVLEERALKARYIAWSRVVKLRGIKASPFVKPVADQYRTLAPTALVAAVRRSLASALTGGAA